MSAEEKFATFRDIFVEAVLMGLSDKEAALIMSRADSLEHATIMFCLAGDGLRAECINGLEAKRARVITAAVRATVAERSNRACVYCQTTEGPFHVDHVRPVSAGGTNDIDNLVYACAPCNLSKGAKPVDVWRKSRKGAKS